MFQKGLKGVVAVQAKIASVDGDKGELRYRGLLVDQAVEGPLHVGAPSRVIDLLEKIQTPRRGEKIMGFGHRIYRTEDPRSVILRKKCLAFQGADDWLDLATAAETEIIRLLNHHKPRRALHTNVKFYAVAIMRSIYMPPELLTPAFSITRIVGWTAHVLEQQSDNVIFRPQSEYIGN